MGRLLVLLGLWFPSTAAFAQILTPSPAPIVEPVTPPTPTYKKLSPWSSGYFKPVWSHPQLNVGAFVDPSNIGQTETGVMIPVIVHDHNDGYWTIPGEDWSPLGIGMGANAGKFSVAIGPMFNILPSMQIAALSALDYFHPKWGPNLRSLLTPAPATNNPDAGISLSPTWKFDGTKGAFRVFSSGYLKF